jgi:transposase
LVNRSAQKLIEELAEERMPAERGWLRSRWSCKLLVLELFKERALVVSPQTLRRVLHRLSFRWRRPRPVAPEKDSEDQREQKRRRLEDILPIMVKKSGIVLSG